MKHTITLILFVTAFSAFAQDQGPDATQASPPNEVYQCHFSMWQNPAIEVVAAKMRARTPEEAIKLRTSTAKATAKEKPALAFWLSEVEKCNQLSLQKMADWSAEARNTVRNHQLEENKAIADLYSGAVTWGAFTEANIARNEAYRTKVAAYDEQQKQAYLRWEAENKRQADAQKTLQEAQAQARYEALAAERMREEAQQRQNEANAKAQAQQNFWEGIMLINASRSRAAPIQQAPRLNCTSRNVLGTVYTDCN